MLTDDRDPKPTGANMKVSIGAVEECCPWQAVALEHSASCCHAPHHMCTVAEEHCRISTDDEIAWACAQQVIARKVSESGPGDVLFIHYSGHGTQVRLQLILHVLRNFMWELALNVVPQAALGRVLCSPKARQSQPSPASQHMPSHCSAVWKLGD